MGIIDLLVASVLVLIMFGIGVSLNWKDTANVLSSPKPLLVALFSQMILLPSIAFVICSILKQHFVNLITLLYGKTSL